ncbi:MAG: nuclease domain-containing protein [Chitinophagales bacterium]
MFTRRVIRMFATLYEYWLFFELLRIVQKIFDIPSKGILNLIKESNDDLSLQLKQGKVCSLDGSYTKGNRKLRGYF